LGPGQVAGVSFTHVALSVLRILLFAAYTLGSFFTASPTFQTSSKDYFNAGVLRVVVVDPEGISISVFFPDETKCFFTGDIKSGELTII
jgi:hypothetical protein